MSKSVFQKVYLKTDKGDLDISDTIQTIKYESDIKKGELVEFRVKSDKSLDLANHKNMVAGAVMTYQMGFIKGLQTALRMCRVGQIEVDFASNRVDLMIKATDKGIEIKKGTSLKVWSNVTLSDIAQEIAGNYGLDFIGDTTTKRYTSLPQGGRSDWDFLNYLILREFGIYTLQVSDTSLILERNSRSKNSIRAFKMGENIISFRTQFKEVAAKLNLDSAQTVGVNNKGEIEKNIPNATPIPFAPSLGFKYNIKEGATYTVETNRGTEYETKDGRFSVDQIQKVKYKNGNRIVVGSEKVSNKISEIADVDANGNITHRKIYTPVEASEGSAVANNMNEQNKAKVLSGTLTIEFDPALKAGNMVTIQLPVDKYSGNWQIETATHTIDSKGAITQLIVNKNGTNRPTKSSKDTNTEGVNTSSVEVSTRENTRIYRGADGNERDIKITIPTPTLQKNGFTNFGQ